MYYTANWIWWEGREREREREEREAAFGALPLLSTL